jgi:hypothetical protein
MRAFLIETNKYDGIIIDGDLQDGMKLIDRIKPVGIDYEGNVTLKKRILKFSIVDVQEPKEEEKED